MMKRAIVTFFLTLIVLGFTPQPVLADIHWEVVYPEVMRINEEGSIDLDFYATERYEVVMALDLPSFRILTPSSFKDTITQPTHYPDIFRIVAPSRAGTYEGTVTLQIGDKRHIEPISIQVVESREEPVSVAIVVYGIIVTLMIANRGEKSALDLEVRVLKLNERPYFEIIDESVKQHLPPFRKTQAVCAHANARRDVYSISELRPGESGLISYTYIVGWKLPKIDPDKVGTDFPKEVQEHMKASAFVESNHPEIIEKALEIVGDEANPYYKVLKTLRFVNDFLEYDPVVPEDKGALWALRNKRGDCTQAAYLSAALLRALGIPARLVGGILVEPHAWIEVYLPNFGWVPADAAIPDLGDLRAHVPMHVDTPYAIAPSILTWSARDVDVLPLTSLIPKERDSHEELASLKSQYKEVLEKHTELEGELGRLRGDYASLQGSYEKLQGDHDELQNNYGELQGSYEKLKEEHDGLKEEFDSIGEEFDRLSTDHGKLQEECTRLSGKYTILRKKYDAVGEELATMNSAFVLVLIVIAVVVIMLVKVKKTEAPLSPTPRH